MRDNNAARVAANDEALISSLVELADTGVDVNTVFDAITNPKKAGAKGVLQVLAKMGVNIGINSVGEPYSVRKVDRRINPLAFRKGIK